MNALIVLITCSRCQSARNARYLSLCDQALNNVKAIFYLEDHVGEVAADALVIDSGSCRNQWLIKVLSRRGTRFKCHLTQRYSLKGRGKTRISHGDGEGDGLSVSRHKSSIECTQVKRHCVRAIVTRVCASNINYIACTTTRILSDWCT